MALAATYGLTADQGATFNQVITWFDETDTPVDLSGYSARMQLRLKVNSAVVLELTTDNGRITLGGSSGVITISVSASDMESLSPGTYSYDLEFVSPSGDVNRLLMGNFVVRSEVTK